MTGPRRLRTYALTGGRTKVDASVLMETLLVARRGVDTSALSPEKEAIHTMCDEPQSIVDLSANLSLPLGVIRVLVSDLIAHGHLDTGSGIGDDPAAIAAVPVHRDLDVLSDLLDGIEAL